MMYIRIGMATMVRKQVLVQRGVPEPLPFPPELRVVAASDLIERPAMELADRPCSPSPNCRMEWSRPRRSTSAGHYHQAGITRRHLDGAAFSPIKQREQVSR